MGVCVRWRLEGGEFGVGGAVAMTEDEERGRGEEGGKG